MRPSIPYSMDELMEFSELQDRTNEAAEELESSFMEIQERHKLSEKEVLFTLARVVDSFIRMHDDFCLKPDCDLNAEAAFNDYYIACRDIKEGDDSNSETILTKSGN